MKKIFLCIALVFFSVQCQAYGINWPAPIIPQEISKAIADDGQIKASWHDFYKKYFNVDIDLSNVTIPVPKPGFSRCIIIIPGVSANSAVAKMREYFSVSMYREYEEDLDKTITHNDRTAKNGAYAIWVKDGVEPENDYFNMSAEDLAKKNITGETCLERLIHGFEYWDKTGKHLDYDNITVCSGSRTMAGTVPWVHLRYDQSAVEIWWCYSNESDYGILVREVSF